MIDYTDRRFAPTTGEAVEGRYRHDGDLVRADFAGAHIRRGHLIGTVDAAGVITAGYCQVLASGEVVGGTVVSHPTPLPDGRVRLTEHWRRADGTSGISQIEELR